MYRPTYRLAYVASLVRYIDDEPLLIKEFERVTLPEALQCVEFLQRSAMNACRLVYPLYQIEDLVTINHERLVHQAEVIVVAESYLDDPICVEISVEARVYIDDFDAADSIAIDDDFGVDDYLDDDFDYSQYRKGRTLA
jgi:hypothetical protein